MVRKLHPMFKRTAARRIQKAWRKKRYQKDTIKTVSDVRKAVQKTAASRAFVANGSVSLTTTPSILQSYSDIPYSEDGVTNPQSRQSLKITMGSIRLRGELIVGDDTNIVRLLLVRSKNQTNTVFAPVDCFFDNNGSAAITAVNAQINTRNVDVLWDSTYLLQDSDSSIPGVRPSFIFLNKTIKIRKTLMYNQANEGDSILPRNMHHYFLVGVSDSSVLPNPSMRWGSCVWFKNVT